MMLTNPNKKAVQILVGKLKTPSFVQKPGEESSSPDMPPGDVNDADYGLQAAADKLISAVHSKDAKAVVSALKDAFEMLDGGGEGSEG